MTGYCDVCGGQLCLCDQMAEDVCRFNTADAVVYLTNRLIEVEAERDALHAQDQQIRLLLECDTDETTIEAADFIHTEWSALSKTVASMYQPLLDIAQARAEIQDLKANQWEPADGIWRVERTSSGRSSTLVAPLDVPEAEAIIRAVLEADSLVATRAIMETYDTQKFCPTMLEHREHDEMCGVWPSAYTIWSSIRDALAKELEDGSEYATEN